MLNSPGAFKPPGKSPCPLNQSDSIPLMVVSFHILVKFIFRVSFFYRNMMWELYVKTTKTPRDETFESVGYWLPPLVSIPTRLYQTASSKRYPSIMAYPNPPWMRISNSYSFKLYVYIYIYVLYTPYQYHNHLYTPIYIILYIPIPHSY